MQRSAFPSSFKTGRDKTRLEGNSRIGGTGTRLLLYGPVPPENLDNIFQYPTGNFPSSTEFREFFPNFPEISNSGIPISFLGLRRDGNWPVPNGWTETQLGRGSSRMLGTGKIWFPGNGIRDRRPLLKWLVILLQHFPFIIKILNLYIILLCTHLYHFFPVSIHYLQWIYCLLHYCQKAQNNTKPH